MIDNCNLYFLMLKKVILMFIINGKLNGIIVYILIIVSFIKEKK